MTGEPRRVRVAVEALADRPERTFTYLLPRYSVGTYPDIIIRGITDTISTENPKLIFKTNRCKVIARGKRGCRIHQVPVDAITAIPDRIGRPIFIQATDKPDLILMH